MLPNPCYHRPISYSTELQPLQPERALAKARTKQTFTGYFTTSRLARRFYNTSCSRCSNLVACDYLRSEAPLAACLVFVGCVFLHERASDKTDRVAECRLKRGCVLLFLALELYTGTLQMEQEYMHVHSVSARDMGARRINVNMCLDMGACDTTSIKGMLRMCSTTYPMPQSPVTPPHLFSCLLVASIFGAAVRGGAGVAVAAAVERVLLIRL